MTQPDDQNLVCDLPGFEQVSRSLVDCGWRAQIAPELGEEIFVHSFQGGRAARCLSFVNQTDQRLLLVGLESLTLASNEDLFPRFLNLPLETRMILALVKLVDNYDWLLLKTANRIELFRVGQEISECRVAFGVQYEPELLPALTALARGRAEIIPTQPRYMTGAESLKGWIRHWSLQLSSALGCRKDEAETILWKWIVMLQLARRTDGSEAHAGWGLQCRRQEGRWTIAFEALSATDDLCDALRAFDRNFRTWLFEDETERQVKYLRQLEVTSLPDRLRAELLMHSQDRFEPETIAWMFTDLQQEQEGWRREVGGVDPIRKRIQHDGWTIFKPLVCDVGKYGLTSALNETGRLAQYINDLNLFAQQRRENGALQPGASQPDLFCQNPQGIGPGGLLEDGLNYMYGEALRLSGVRKDQRFGVGVVFLLKALALSPRMRWPFRGLTTLDRLFETA